MTIPASAVTERGFKAPGTTTMVAGGLIGAILAYVFQAVGIAVLGDVGFAPIAAIWTAIFILASILLVPLEQYATRETSRGRALATDIKVVLWVGAAGMIGGAAFVLLTLDSLFVGNPVFVGVMVALVAGYTILFSAKGVLAGNRRFADVGWVLILEGVVRLVAGLAILAIVAEAWAMAWAMALAPLAVLILRFWRHDRVSGDAQPVGARRFLGAYIGGSSASQLLLAGAPLGVAALGGGPGLFSAVFILFTTYRAPLTLIYALQSRVLPHLVTLATDDDHAGLRRIAVRVLGLGVGLTVLGGLAGWLVGPAVVELLFEGGVRPAAAVAMLTAGGMMAASTAQIGGQVLVARAHTGHLAAAWGTGLVAAIVVMLLASGTPDFRVALGFAAGEVMAMAAVGFLITRA